MKVEKIFETGLQYHHYANTAYPLTPLSFKSFRIKTESEIRDLLQSEWMKTDELSLYIHIPFCKTRCKFCEYVVLENSEDIIENEYVSLLLKEIDMYKKILQTKKIVGYDMGGGTPTKLSIENIQKITDSLKNSFNFSDDTIFSIETTPIIAAKELEKIEAIYKMGYKRISMGIQTISEKLLNDLGREGTTHIYEKAVWNIRKAGYSMFNIDLMYGFLHQDDSDFKNTIYYTIALKPEYITLYRNRYKGTKIEKEAGGVSLYKAITQYRLAYKILLDNGYYANPGKNTFSRVDGDYGTSDYLTKRVINGVPYLGLGLGAQSFGVNYLSYNDGAASKQLSKYREKIENGLFPIQDIYALDEAESIAKMISVAFYFGFVDLDAFQKRFKISFLEHFKNEIEYLIENRLMEIKDNRVYLTSRGSDYINGVIPLFYSDRSKKELLELYEKSKINLDSGELEFLKVYNIKEYEKPSLAVDIVSILVDSNQNMENSLSIVLIKRGEHPFMNSWALPGGFVKANESAEMAAYRELKEECGLDNIELSQLQLFSEPKRDPRGWIVSCSFLGVIEKQNIPLLFGDDAIDSKVFNISFSKEIVSKNQELNIIVEKIYLKLTYNDTILSSIVEKTTKKLKFNKKEEYRVIEANGIAFDHAKIVLTAIERISHILIK
ncbi:NUDIX domain-containing protein [bacterium]|nr:NUDIX domain-containing protein [bacterium]